MTWYGTVAWINPPLGSGFSGIIFDDLDMCAEWTIPACRNSFYGQNVRLVDAVLLMCQGNNGRITLLPTWRLIHQGAFTVTPWCRPPAWQLSAAHGGGYGATSPASTDVVTNQASAHIQMSRASLDKCWSHLTTFVADRLSNCSAIKLKKKHQICAFLWNVMFLTAT